MTPASKLGEAFRKLSSLTSARTVRVDDDVRSFRRADESAFAKRADQIAAEALAVERGLIA